MDTWNVFSGSDLFLGLLGAAGFLSMIVVISTASSRVNKREVVLAQARRLQNLEPEENVMSDDETVEAVEWDEEDDPYYYNGENYYETSGK